MLTVALVAAVVGVVVHVMAFALESLLFSRPAVWRRFGVTSQRDADAARLIALNQGFYNLFLAAGALVGVVEVALGHRTIGATLIAFAAASMLAAGIVLLATGGSRFLRTAAIQAVPPLVALIALATA